MKKTLQLSFAIFLAVSAVNAQKADDSRDALAVVNKMFAEMANHNPTAIAELFFKDSNLTALISRRDGKKQVSAFTGEVFSKNFAEKRGEINETMYAPTVSVDGDLAVVHGRYVFFVDGKVSHCGLNSFNLVRAEGVWKIANAISSIDPGSCTEKERAMKAPAAVMPPTKSL